MSPVALPFAATGSAARHSALVAITTYLGVGFFHTLFHKRPTIRTRYAFFIREVLAYSCLVLLTHVATGTGVCGLTEAALQKILAILVFKDLRVTKWLGRIPATGVCTFCDLSFAKMSSSLNAFEISNIQKQETEYVLRQNSIRP